MVCNISNISPVCELPTPCWDSKGTPAPHTPTHPVTDHSIVNRINGECCCLQGSTGPMLIGMHFSFIYSVSNRC